MKILINIVFIVLSPFLISCAIFEPKEQTVDTDYLHEKVVDPSFIKETEELKAASNLFGDEKYSEAKKKYQEFLKKYPQSINHSEAVYGLALSAEALGEFDLALAEYERLSQFKFNGANDYPARALYRMSFCQESLGNNEKAIMALKDAENMGLYLPPEIALAELPARLAALYAKIGLDALADSYMERAEQGIKKLKIMRKNVTGDWLGASLYQMGSVSLNQLSIESFEQTMNSINKAQKYLLQAVLLDDSKWNLKAKEEIVSLYVQLLQFIKSRKVNESDHQIGMVATANLQAELSGQVLEAIEQLKSYSSPIEEKKPMESDLFKSLIVVEEEAKGVLLSRLYYAPLTPEAQRLQDLKRNIKLQDVNLSSPPAESEAVPEGVPTVLPKKKKSDPNL